MISGCEMFDFRAHLQIQTVFFKVLFPSFFGREEYHWANHKLFRGHTFRVTGARAEHDLLASLRYAKRSLDLIWNQRESGVSLRSTTFYCHKEKQKNDLIPYLDFVLQDKLGEGLYRDTMQIGLSFSWKFWMTIQLIFMFPFFLLITLFSKRKSTIALVLLQWTENNIMAQVLACENVHRVYLFGGYENDEGITGLFCEKLKVELILVPPQIQSRTFTSRLLHTVLFLHRHFKRKNIKS